MKALKTLCLGLLLTVTPAAYGHAATACYTPAEAEADQGIRIHSELMVIGLNCQHLGKRFGENLYGDYRQMTANNADLFAQYETTLIDFYKKQGVKNPVASLNDLRTRYANKISDDAASMRPDIFCSRYAPRVQQAKAMKREDLRKWASMSFPKHPVSHSVCKK